jgi:hypothetical protein
MGTQVSLRVPGQRWRSGSGHGCCHRPFPLCRRGRNRSWRWQRWRRCGYPSFAETAVSCHWTDSSGAKTLAGMSVDSTSWHHTSPPVVVWPTAAVELRSAMTPL